MKMKKIMTAAAAVSLCSMMLCGCAGTEEAITTENAPTEMMKTLAGISSDSSSSEVLGAFESIISATAQAYDYKLEMRSATETSSPYFNGATLDKMVTAQDSRDIRYATDKGVYELLEQDSSGQQMLGVMNATATATQTVYASYDEGGYNVQNSKGLIEYLENVPSTIDLTDEEVKQSAQSMVTYPLYALVGASLILQPFTSPEYYEFHLEQQGDDYVFTISIKDQEAYNAYLDAYVEENYGYSRTDLDGTGTVMAEVYDTQKVDIELTMDENGVLKKIINNNFNVISVEGTEVKAYTKQTCLLSAVPAGTEEFFTTFFKNVENGTYTEGSVFDIDLGMKGEVVSDTADASSKESDASSEESIGGAPVVEDTSETSADNAD